MDLKKYKSNFNKVLIFYKPNSADYWNSITKCSVNSKPNKLGRYYLNFSSKSEYTGKLDANGIPIYKHRNFDPFYHPIVVSQYAFGLFEKFYFSDYKNEHYRHKFLLQVDWLVKNYSERNGNLGWYIKYDVEEWKLRIPWFSAMAQGEAISVLSRGYFLTQNESYLILAERALKLFETPVCDGGLINYFNSIPVFEEYPSPIKTVAVLNGFIFTIFGFYDLWLANKSEKAFLLFNQGISSLKKLLSYYDLGYWSQYFLFNYPKKYPASYTYHHIAIEQLKALHYITGVDIFLEYSDKWTEQSKSFTKKTRALFVKIFFARILK